ncbi:MAG TPA: ABC transporter substrate-binding protein [Candidatus Brocadiaceae bacterium]|nr:ABC transporter substrate-binding protein [Candidatus Brocadiaceae bacterium]
MIRRVKQAIVPCIYIFVLSWVVYTSFRTKQKDEIVFCIGAGAEEIRCIKTLVAKFEAANPATKVALNVLPASTDQQHHYYITTLGAKNKDVDVMRIDTIWVAEFASACWLEPLDSSLTTGQRGSFIPIIEKNNVFRNKLYAIPWNANIGVLYYRKDLLDKYNLHPPETWDELITTCSKISANEPVMGYLWQGKQYEGMVCNFIEFISSNNGGIFDDTGRIIVESVQNKKALNLMRDMLWKYRISPPNTHSELMEESSRHLFQQGKALFLRNWTYVWELCQEDPSMKGKVGVSLLPAFSEGKHASVYGGWHLAINSRSEKKKQAWQFIEFLTSETAQKELAINLSWLPSKKALYKDLELNQRLPFLPTVELALQDVQIRPNLPYYPWVSDILQRHVNKALSNQTNSDDTLRTIHEKLKGIGHEFAEK